MNEQRIVTAYVDPTNGTRALAQIRAAAGPGNWRIVSLVAVNHQADKSRHSPGIVDPHLLEGEPVLVLLELEMEAAPVKSRESYVSEIG